MAQAAMPGAAGGELSTEGLPPARQYEAWRDAVSATHLAWDLPRRSDSRFRGRVRSHRLGEGGIVQCICDPCRGRRGRAEIARTAEPAFGLLYVTGGRERVVQNGREADLAAGSLMLWDSRRPVAFEAPERLSKITLMLPQHLLEPALPGAADMVALPFSAAGGAGALLAAHLRVLARQGAGLGETHQGPVLQAGLELLAAALEAAADRGGAGHRRAALDRICSHILAHLDDPELSPERVATALGISTRQLHRIFAESGWTVDRWIWRQRLLRCRQELSRPGREPVSQIAYRWGFSDAAHFSRAFRRAFGTSPKAFRAARAR